jgi:hypothetical protein
MVWPEVLNEDPQRISESFELPDEAMRLVPEDWRQSSNVKA